MLYKRIHYFLEAAKCLNFTEAAKHVFISQQAMTWHISALEEELGVRLFIRSTRSVKLTEAGIYLRDQFSRINDEIVLCIDEARALGNQNRSAVTIGIYESFSRERIILPILSALQSRWPDIYFNVQLLGLDDLKNQLLDEKLDLAITTSYTWKQWNTITARLIKRFPFHIVLAADHPLVKQGFSLEALSEIPLLTNEKPSQYHSENLIQKMPLWRQRLPHKHYVHLPDMNTLLLYLEMKQGFACLTDELEGTIDNSRLAVFPIPDPDAASDMICAYPRRNFNPMAEAFARAAAACGEAFPKTT